MSGAVPGDPARVGHLAAVTADGNAYFRRVDASDMDRVAVFGIGSTNFRSVAAAPDGEFLTDVAVERTRPCELADQVLAAVEALERECGTVDAVAVATAGLVDADAGVVAAFDPPAGETIEAVDLGRPLADRGLPLALENDASAAALGEWYFGARADERCLAHVTIGTGIGGGVVTNGRLHRGAHGQAGEFGLIPVGPHDLASTGVTGAWEAVASGRGIPEFFRYCLAESDAERALDPDAQSGHDPGDGDLTAADVFDAAPDDPVAAECLERVARYDAAGVGAVCNVVDPDLVTLGGGVVSAHPEWTIAGVERHLEEFCFVDEPDVRTTALGDHAGLYGALATYRARRDSLAAE